MMADKDYTPEQIIEWWKCCSMHVPGKDCGDCPIKDDCDAEYNEYGNCEDLFGRIACRAAELLYDALEREKERQWISVKDRLPDKGESVIVRAITFEQKVHVDTNFRSVIDGRFSWDKVGKGNCKVTHWMPLPAPPEYLQEKP